MKSETAMTKRLIKFPEVKRVVIGAKNPTPALFRSASRAIRMSSYSSCTYCAFSGRLRRYARLRSASSFRSRDTTVIKRRMSRRKMFVSRWKKELTPPWRFFDEESADA